MRVALGNNTNTSAQKSLGHMVIPSWLCSSNPFPTLGQECFPLQPARIHDPLVNLPTQRRIIIPVATQSRA